MPVEVAKRDFCILSPHFKVSFQLHVERNLFCNYVNLKSIATIFTGINVLAFKASVRHDRIAFTALYCSGLIKCLGFWV